VVERQLAAEPGFHPGARYEFKVHLGGTDFETLTYRVSFGEADSGGRQALRLHALLVAAIASGRFWSGIAALVLS
jgi:hypothetical protein